ncbi:MAG: hypothetical protein H6631_19150 [Anaerolineaceae bacterium]|nr:hypothetical protein [Anaerolineaceae bacterium]
MPRAYGTASISTLDSEVPALAAAVTRVSLDYAFVLGEENDYSILTLNPIIPTLESIRVH